MKKIKTSNILKDKKESINWNFSYPIYYKNDSNVKEYYRASRFGIRKQIKCETRRATYRSEIKLFKFLICKPVTRIGL